MVTADLPLTGGGGRGWRGRSGSWPSRTGGSCQVHCYRMLGSFARRRGTAVQERRLLAAWQGHRRGFTEETRPRCAPGLYKIATNRWPQRAPAAGQPAPRPGKRGHVAVPTARADPAATEAAWAAGRFLTPLLDGAAGVPLGPEARLRADPRPSPLGLRGRPAGGCRPRPRVRRPHLAATSSDSAPARVAGMLEVTVESVSKRPSNEPAASLQAPANSRAAGHQPPPARRRLNPPEDAIVGQVSPARVGVGPILDALVALLTDDIFIAMAAGALSEYEGRDAVTRYWARQFRRRAAGSTSSPTRANGQARIFGAYLRSPGRQSAHATGFYVAHPGRRPRFCAMTRFEASVLPWFRATAITPGPGDQPWSSDK